MSFIAWTYDFSTALVPPPVATQIRLNAAHPYTAVTAVYVRNLTTTGLDVHVVLMAIPAGATLYVQDKNDHTLFGRFETAGAPIDQTDYVEFPVTWQANGAALVQQEIQLAVITEATLPPDGGPGALTLEEAKDHLHITDSDHDADISAKLAEAEALVDDYLSDPRDPAPTPDALLHRAAVKLVLAHLYENRGEAQDPNDEALWQALGRLLRRQRTPALA